MLKLIKNLYPDEWIDSTYSIDFKKYYEEGYRGVIFDIDNTLVPHGADADDRAIGLIDTLREQGFQICLLSNNRRGRVERFNKNINVNYIFKAQKPYHKNYYIAAMMMRLSVGSVICIGDQLFTDIYGANESQMHTILVNPINKKEEIQIILKRRLEAIVLHFYKKLLKKEGRSYPDRRQS